MKKLTLIIILFLTSQSVLLADELALNTAVCRMEVKILGYEALEEDKDCVWLVENLDLVVKQCSECLPDLELIKEASQGYFDY